MSKIFKTASAVAIFASTLSILVNSDAGFAFEQTENTGLIAVSDAAAQENMGQDNTGQTGDINSSNINSIPGEVVQPLPEDYIPIDQRPAEPVVEETYEPAITTAASLRELVNLQGGGQTLSKDMRCLAGAIYFESKGEPLMGQLAVAKVIINRAKSSRFPSSYCGVVYQKSQFSFVRGGRMPRIRTGTQAWRNAKAIAQIADAQGWSTPVDNALFFHARRVSPGWRLTRVGTVGNHVFYR